MPKELIQLYREAVDGSEIAMGQLVAQMMPAIRKGAGEVAGPGLDYEDAQQEGLIGLFSAIKHYDEEKGASFSTYAFACIQNAQLSARRSATRQKNVPLNNSLPLEDSPQQLSPNPEEQVLAAEALEDAMRQMSTALSGMERQVLLYTLDGLPGSEIAARLSVTPKAVENALGRARRKLRQNQS